MVTHDGFEVVFDGEYRELIPDKRIVLTEVYEGIPDAESIKTVTLAERDECTTLTMLVQHQSQEHRNAHTNSGMESDTQKALDHLEAEALAPVLAELFRQ